jgi:hypothetical protein
MDLPPRRGGAPVVQPKPVDPAVVQMHREMNAHTERWMATAMRPDVYGAPVQMDKAESRTTPAESPAESRAEPAESRGESPAESPEEPAESRAEPAVLMYYSEGDRVVVAPVPEDDTVEARQAAFERVGAASCPAEVAQVVPGDPSWPLFHALYLAEEQREGEIDWDFLAHLVGKLKLAGGLGEMLDMSARNTAWQPGLGQMVPKDMHPGPWEPPGQQPIPFYIGNQAHDAIADYYEEMHREDQVFSNHLPLATVLKERQKSGVPGLDAAALGGAGALRPDILNATRHHLYEIKPAQGQAVAATEATVYVTALARAGLVVTLGPSTEPGTSGVVPAPAGFFHFWSPAAGVIVYQYQKPQPVPVVQPVAQPREQPAFDMSRVLEWKYWEQVTGLTGTALLVYLMISEGSRVIPWRNAIPVP